MRLFFRLIAIGLSILLLSFIAVLYLTIENEPRVDRTVTIAPEHLARIKHLIDNHRQKVQPGERVSAKILPQDFDMAMNYLAHLFVNGRAKTILSEGEVSLRLTYPLPDKLLTGYLNVETTFTETDHLPSLQTIRIGHVQLPEFLTRFLVQQFLQWLQNNYPEFWTGLDALQQISISQNGLNIVYRWQGSLFGKTNDVTVAIPMISQQERARIYRYHLMLVNQHRFKNGTAIPLSEFLAPAMRLATKQSIHGNPVEENRAVILVTTFHVLGLPLHLLFPEASSWPKPAGLKITLDGRDDFAKHFMVSAAITAYADTALSEAIGIYKEIEDAQSGSGFSFNDIAANHAGTRFAEKAVASRISALKIQKIMAVDLKDSDLMPAWSDLPEHMTESEFAAHFGGTDSVGYRHLIKKIEQRVAALKILH